MNAPDALLTLVAAVSLLFSCQSETASEISETSETHWSYYGDSITNYDQRISAEEAANMLAETGAASGLFEVEIVQSCLTMGCWMSVKGAHEDTLMVFMKDHAFFVPKDSLQGKTAYFVGEAFYDTVSVDLQKHLLEDAGASEEEIDAVTEPSFELAFEASGVMIADVPDGAPMAGAEN